MVSRYTNKDNVYLKGFKIQIFPDDKQKQYIERNFEIARYVYNWALEKENEQYQLYKEGKVDKKHKFLSAYSLHRLYTNFRKQNAFLESFPYEAARIIINDLVYAFESFWRFDNKYPKFKSRKRSKNSFPVRSDRVYFEDNMLRIEGLKRRTGKIFTNYHTHEKKNDNIKYYNTRIVKDLLGRYWFCFKKEVIKPVSYNYFDINQVSISEPIGIDLNARPTIVLSNGQIYDRPNTDKINKRIKKLNRHTARDKKCLEEQQKELERTNSVFELLPSNNAKKRIHAFRKAHNRKANIKENFVQTATTKIVKSRPAAIVIEDLSVRKMESLHNVAATIRDSNIYRIIELLQYKCSNYGIPLITANKFYPSSQICSCCGAMKKIGSNKLYRCDNCGMVENRHLNAAKNLVKLAYEY